MRIFRQSSFVLFSKHYRVEIDPAVEKQALQFNRNSYKETIQLQIFFAENHIPFTYTDTISLSELSYLYSILNEYLKEKNDSLERINNEG